MGAARPSARVIASNSSSIDSSSAGAGCAASRRLAMAPHTVGQLLINAKHQARRRPVEIAWQRGQAALGAPQSDTVPAIQPEAKPSVRLRNGRWRGVRARPARPRFFPCNQRVPRPTGTCKHGDRIATHCRLSAEIDEALIEERWATSRKCGCYHSLDLQKYSGSPIREARVDAPRTEPCECQQRAGGFERALPDAGWPASRCRHAANRCSSAPTPRGTSNFS